MKVMFISFRKKFWQCGLFRAQTNIEMYPNPAKDQVTVKLKEINGQKNSKELRDIKEIKIVDKQRNIKKIMKYPANTKSVNVNISDLQMDIYFIEISDGINKGRMQLSIQK